MPTVEEVIAGVVADIFPVRSADAAFVARKVATALREADKLRECMKPDDVEWVVNDLAELGVKIGDQFFFLYKGRSLVYEPGETAHEDVDPDVGYFVGDPMRWRHVGKREFGECCHPVNYKDLTRIGTVSYRDGGDWQPLPPLPEGTEK